MTAESMVYNFQHNLTAIKDWSKIFKGKKQEILAKNDNTW